MLQKKKKQKNALIRRSRVKVGGIEIRNRGERFQNLIYRSQFLRRLQASIISASLPANESRILESPRSGSKSNPGVQATPISLSISLQNSELEFVKLEMSA